MQAKEDSTALQEEAKLLKVSVAEAEAKEADIITRRDGFIAPIGNIVHDSVPIDNDEVRSAFVAIALFF